MMGFVECPRPALDKLKNFGLDERILGQQDKWDYLAISSPSNGDLYPVFDKARKFVDEFKGGDIERFRFFSSILELETKLTKGFVDKQEALLEHPEALAYMLLGEDIFKYADLEYTTRRQLEEVITSFCLGDISHQMFDSDYMWVHGSYKNKLTNGCHGDCHIFQENISGSFGLEQTLFGEEEVFDTIKILGEQDRGVIFAHWDAWEVWLVSLLKSAREMGLGNSPRITKWKNVLKDVGSSEIPTAEAMFGDGKEFAPYNLTDSVITKGKKITKNPISIPDHTSEHRLYLPYVDVEEGKVYFITEDKQGDIVLPCHEEAYFAGKKYRVELEYDEHDLAHALAATYKLFGRDRSRLPLIMDAFINGKLEKEYWEALRNK